MRILALEKEKAVPVGGIPESCLREEALRVWELYQSGALREIHFRTDRSTAVLLLECRDAADAASILKTLPLVEKGMISFEIIPLKPYPGLARLFRR